MSDRRHPLIAIALLFAMPAMWSTNYIAARAAVGHIEPYALAFGRWLIVAAVMLPLAWPALRAGWPAWWREWPDLLLLGALGMWICGAFVYIGAQTTTGLNIGIIYAASPVLIAAASTRLFGERLGPRQLLGLALALAGVALIVCQGSPATLAGLRFTPGDIWIVIATLSWSAYSLLLRGRPSRLDPFARLAAIAVAGVLVLAPFTVWEAVTHGLPKADLRVPVLIGVIALVPGLAAYLTYSYLQRQIGAARTALAMYLGPPYTAFAAWLILGEMPLWYHCVGTALLLPGIWLATGGTGTAATPVTAGTARSL